MKVDCMKQKNLITFLGGALVGAGLTWLFTSKEGKEWLQKFKSGSADLKSKLVAEMDELKQQMDNTQHSNNKS
jgi:hypothetical protein